MAAGAGGSATGSGGSTSVPNTGGTGGAGTGGAGGSASPPPPDAGAPAADARRDTAPAATPDTRPPDNRPPLIVTPPQPDASPPPPDMMAVAPPDTGPNAMLPPPPAPGGPGAPLTPCSGGCPGLRGEYFDNDDFTGSKFVRQDARIDFVWEDTPPDPSMEKDNFSVRWVGKIRPRFSESYTFSVEHNDNVRLWVAGRQLLNVFDNSGRRTTEAPTIQLVADQAEDILIEFRERTGDAQITMSWRSNSQDREVVPAAALFWVAPAAPAP
jgi:PA14 domain